MTAWAARNKRDWLIVLVLLIVVVGIVFVGYLWVDWKLHPTRTEIEAITEGMTQDEVVERLGALYDSARPGESTTVDRVLAGRESGKRTANVMMYPVSRSRDTGWILIDGKERVLEGWIEERD